MWWVLQLSTFADVMSKKIFCLNCRQNSNWPKPNLVYSHPPYYHYLTGSKADMSYMCFRN